MCYATGDAVQIVNWFYCNLISRNYDYNYNTVTHLQSLHANLFSLSVAVFMYSVSLNHTLQIKPSIHTSQTDLLYSSVLLVSLRPFSLRLTWTPLHSLRKQPENCLDRHRCLQVNSSARTTEKTHLPHIVAKECLLNDCPATVVALTA
jgi:hypothetical protein